MQEMLIGQQGLALVLSFCMCFLQLLCIGNTVLSAVASRSFQAIFLWLVC